MVLCCTIGFFGQDCHIALCFYSDSVCINCFIEVVSCPGSFLGKEHGEICLPEAPVCSIYSQAILLIPSVGVAAAA